MHPTSTFDLVLLDHADRIAAARQAGLRARARRSARARTAPDTRAPEPERPPESRPLWAWSDSLLPATVVGAVAR